jgi:hypothetical protein
MRRTTHISHNRISTINNTAMEEYQNEQREEQPDCPKFFPHVRGYYYPGTYVRLSSGAIARFHCAPRYLGENVVQIEELRPFKEAEAGFDIKRHPLDDPNLLKMTELVPSGVLKIHEVKHFIEVVFVFNLGSLKSQFPHVPIMGMRNAYICRYDASGLRLEAVAHNTFPSDDVRYKLCNIVCENRLIWTSIVAIQGEMRRLLGRISEKQGIFSRSKGRIRISPPAWFYIIRQLSGKVVTKNGNRSSYKRFLGNGLLLSSVKLCSETKLLRFETTEEIEVFTSIFGRMSVVDVRKRRPRKDQTQEIASHDSINVIVGSEEKEDPYVHYTTKDGVDFVYDGDELAINIRYRLYVLRRSRQTKQLIDCPSEALVQIINRKVGADNDSDASDDDSDSDAIAENGEFTNNNRLYRVIDYYRNSHVMAQCIYPIRNNNHLNLTERFDNLDEIRECLNND